ncbi:MAG: hypothetical protein KA313_10565 [Pseudarcicella sp.]|nr:hypothetical protein [Pseudarcicella sp.]MBP6411531.1 hypothetical protein [Pseudarcicella sp.]
MYNFSSSERKIEIYLLDFTSNSGYSCENYFVVDNYNGNDEKKLKTEIDKFNKFFLKNKNISSLVCYKKTYRQYFYEETWEMDRNYRPGCFSFFDIFLESGEGCDDVSGGLNYNSHYDDFLTYVVFKTK